MMLVAGVLGAMMLYTHLGGVLILAADGVIIIREFRRDGRSVTWPAVAIAGFLFLPFVPVAVAQTGALLFGHWMDWLGSGAGSATKMLLVGPAAAGLGAVARAGVPNKR